MKQLVIFFIFLLSACEPYEEKQQGRNAYKCYGETPCKVCSSCNYCKYCNSGGNCGICENEKRKNEDGEKNADGQFDGSGNNEVRSHSRAARSSGFGRCQAITKKGTQCKRNARSNGYCYQHAVKE